MVGLTGPIGSGKSTVAKVFLQNGYKSIDADKLARQVVEKNSPALKLLAENFGDDIINTDGTLNRKLLAKRAFVSKEKTELLNSITHPAILELVKEKIAKYKSQGANKLIYDAPLLFESNSHKLCDTVVVVVADKQDRINRVKLRDNMSQSELSDRINRQHEDSFYTQKADYVINNDSTLDDLIQNTLNVIVAIQEVQNVTL